MCFGVSFELGVSHAIDIWLCVTIDHAPIIKLNPNKLILKLSPNKPVAIGTFMASYDNNNIDVVIVITMGICLSIE